MKSGISLIAITIALLASFIGGYIVANVTISTDHAYKIIVKNVTATSMENVLVNVSKDGGQDTHLVKYLDAKDSFVVKRFDSGDSPSFWVTYFSDDGQKKSTDVVSALSDSSFYVELK